MPSKGSNVSASPVSVRRLAEALGTSRSTVSRAFRGDASVRPELRERILAEAGRLGYRPDPLVSELMTNFARRRPIAYRETIGVLWWSERWAQAELAEPNYANRLRGGLERAAGRHGCRLTHFVLREGGAAALARTLRARGIRGVVLTPPSTPGTEAPALDWAELSAVAIGRSLSAPVFNSVHHNHYAAMVLALRRVREAGCLRPVLLVGTGLEERMQRAYTGAFLAHEPGPGAAERVLHMEARGPAALARRLRGLDADVVIADVEGWAEGLRALPAALRPKRLAVLDVARRDGAFAGIRQSVDRMAECAVDLLMQGRFHQETGVPAEPIDVQTPGAWVDGASMAGG